MGTSSLAAAASGQPEYCKVLAEVDPVDRHAPPINIEVNLPVKWNHEAFQFGGGGMDGALVTGLGNVPGAGNSGTPIATPLQRGYATFGSDSGHTGGEADASFAINAEAAANFEGDQIKKTHDAAQYLIRELYGSKPAEQYMAGGSNGGRETLLAAQRWPQDYNGIIAYYPVASFDGQVMELMYDWKLIYGTPGAWMNPTKVALLTNAVKASCAANGGVVNGIVMNPDACTGYDPTPLECPGGADTGNNCLSAVQIKVWKEVTSPVQFNNGAMLTGGWTSYPGYAEYNFATVYTANGAPQPNSSYAQYYIWHNPRLTYMTTDISDDIGEWLSEATKMDVTTDFTKFRDLGGKIIWVQGYDDDTLFLQASVALYDRLQQEYGASNLESWLRFYGVPGFSHGHGDFDASFDSVTTLQNWVQKGQAPPLNGLTVADSNAATQGRTLPLCEWPYWPKYDGTGDVNVASSFTCVEE